LKCKSPQQSKQKKKRQKKSDNKKPAEKNGKQKSIKTWHTPKQSSKKKLTTTPS